MTQEAAAKAYGVALRSVINWERGMQGAQMHLRRKVLAHYGLPFEEHRKYFGPLQFDTPDVLAEPPTVGANNGD